MMEAIYECCAGADVHSKTVKVCVRKVNRHHGIQKETRTFGTMTRDLLAMGDWLAAEGVTHLAMESTGVFWKPIYNLLEGHFEIVLVNARHVKNVPGRKTDVCDAEWLAQLLQCGLLRASFIPSRPQRELRDLTRMRSQFTHEMASVINRIHKILQDANIKLGCVVTDVVGVSGRSMLRALIEGETDTEKMADLARRKLRAKIPELQLALEGKVTEHHRFLLQALMDHLAYLEHQIELFSRRIEDVSRPFEKAIRALIPMPGFQMIAAQNLIAEIGPDMSQFRTDAHLCSWAKICPGNNESAGKRKSGTTGNGNRWLISTLVQIAWAASRTKGSYFQAQFRRLAGRRGKKRALIAVAHSILTDVYHILKTGQSYRDLGGDYFDRRQFERVRKYHVSRLESLGFKVELESAA